MNIFYVDADPIVAADALIKRHVVKMIVESAQLLSTAHRVLDGKEIETRSKSGARLIRYNHPSLDAVLYKSTHVNHPSAIWVRECSANYQWLYDHLVHLCARYSSIYGKTHKTGSDLLAHLQQLPTNIPLALVPTSIPCAMDDIFILDDPVQSYRSYYEAMKLPMGDEDDVKNYYDIIDGGKR